MKMFLTAALAASCVLMIGGCDRTESLPSADSQVAAVPSQNEGQPAESEQATPSDPAQSKPSQENPDATTEKTATSSTADSNPSAGSEKASPARRTPAKNGEAEHISFEELNCGMQADIQFRPWMLTERVKELDGQKIRVAGYMNPDSKQKGITEFVLLRNTECKFGPSGQADHLIRVKLKEGVTTSYSISPIEVTGVLTVNPFTGPDGNTWSIYDLEGEAVGAPRR